MTTCYRGIHFPRLSCASGARGMYGEGYWFHRILKLMGLRIKRLGLTTKTGTMDYRAKRRFPVRVYFFRKLVLNAFGLSNPGFTAILATGRLQQLTENFFISFAAVSDTMEQRLEEARAFVKLLKKHMPEFCAQFGIEINFSCPNTGVHVEQITIAEVHAILDILSELNVPLKCKFNATMSVAFVSEACAHPACDALVMSNSIPYGALPHRINWKKLFGKKSPLARLGGGALSGWLLLKIVCDWIREARAAGFTKPIEACGGFGSPESMEKAYEAGADTAQIGTDFLLYPWHVAAGISRGEKRFVRGRKRLAA